MILLLLPPL